MSVNQNVNGTLVPIAGNGGGSGSGGIVPHFIIATDTGSTVSVIKNGIEISAIETSTGIYECDLKTTVPQDVFGTWTIHSVFNNIDKTVDVIVDIVKVYEVNAYHWKATITTNFPYSVGVECTCSNNGQVILTANTSPYTFNIYNAGTYTVDFLYKGKKTYQTVVVSEDGEALICDYTPSVAYQDDVPIWLWFGGVDEDYYSATDVASDKDAMVKLMSSNDAVDYVKNAVDIAKNYTIPHMTSNTSPSGVVSASSNNETAYKVFSQNRDRMGSNCSWNPVSDETNSYLRYDYGKATTTNSILYRLSGTLGNVSSYTIKIQGSNDETNWTTIDTISVTSISGTMIYNKTYTASTYRYIQLLFEDTIQSTSGGANFKIYGAQFYNGGMARYENVAAAIGASDYASDTLLKSTWRDYICNSEYFESVLNVKVPTMTSNTTPSGECFGDQAFSASSPAYKAFDGDSSTHALASTSLATASVGYDFGTAVKIYSVGLTGTQSPRQYTPSYSDDKTNWTDCSSYYTADGVYPITVAGAHRYWKITRYYPGNTTTGIIAELQFYGRQNGGVQDWLRAGGITDKDYTTLAEVLNDSTALTTLMSSEDAVDYLVTCTQWADTICSDQTAMSYIGLNNYASNTLLADSTWASAICNSTYFESVLNVKVPTMTSDNTPSGVASASSVYNSSTYAYLAFDNDSSTGWAPAESSAQNDMWLQYQFTSAVKVKKLHIVTYSEHASRISALRVKGSNNGIDFTTLDTYTGTVTDDFNLDITNDNDYLYYRLEYDRNTNFVARLMTVQFYGRADV